jgi:tetratricopeptide (TPR) repeat protein
MRVGLVLAAAAIASAAPARADSWYEHYEQAEKALEAEDWAVAVEQLNQALERRGDSGARVRTYGMKVIEYFPYLKLGIAYYRLGQPSAALQAFETEERLGAIERSESAQGELRKFRALAREAQQAAASAEEQRIEQIVSDSLREAGSLEAQGRLDDAMSALGRGLAVDPDNAEALSVMERLRTEVARQQAALDLDARVARLVEEGKELLEAGRYGDASSVLRQALALKPGGERESLLAQAQTGLRTELQRDRDARARATLIADGLSRAREREAAGQLADALTDLESVLALDPSNREALGIQGRLLEARARDEQESGRRETLQRLLAEAEAGFAAGRYEDSLSAANRSLALDPGNATALKHVARAYGEISRRLLGKGRAQNIPPAIRFADFRQEQDDGSQLQVVRERAFRLSGVIIDDSPVEVVLRDRDDRVIQAPTASQGLGDYYITEFKLDHHHLTPGHSVFRITATDSAGLTSSSEYAVLYSRPFHRAPWFYALAAGVVLALVGAVYVQRLRQRERLLRRQFNPYVAGAPVIRDDLFFGRQRLLDRVLQTLPNNSVLLYGERRIGKTSLQHHLRKRIQGLEDPDYAFFPVIIDLQGTPEERFFSTLAEDIFQQLAPLLDGLQPSVPDSGSTDYSYREFLRDVHKVVRILKEKSSKQVKLVLLMDEVDELNSYDPRINQRLRSLFMKSFAENLVSVVSGVEIKKHWERAGSPWYNFFEEIEVTPFRREDAAELIERPIRGVFRLEKGVVDRIISLTESKPYLIQKLCVALVNRLHEEKRRTITLADVEALGATRES